MKAIYCIVTVILLSLASSCNQDEPTIIDSEGVVRSKPYIWRTQLSEHEYIGGWIDLPVMYDGGMLAFGMKGSRPVLHSIDIETGESRWKWNDFLEPEWEEWSVGFPYTYDKYLFVQDGSRVYCLDLTTGKTFWKKRYDFVTEFHVSGLGSKYFSIGVRYTPEKYSEADVYIGDLLQGSEKDSILTPNYSREQVSADYSTLGNIYSVVPYMNDASDTVLLINYADYDKEGQSIFYLGKYNLTKRQWLYENKPSAGTSYLFEGRLYSFTGGVIMCHNITTGDIIWQTPFPHGFFSPFIIAEDKVLANCEDTYLYALDIATGRQLYKVKSSGTSGAMSYLNGVVYYVGGGDGLLHAVEVSTGKHLWKIESPDLSIRSGAWFKTEGIGVVAGENGERGKVLVSSFLSAFCYEAAR